MLNGRLNFINIFSNQSITENERKKKCIVENFINIVRSVLYQILYIHKNVRIADRVKYCVIWLEKVRKRCIDSYLFVCAWKVCSLTLDLFFLAELLHQFIFFLFPFWRKKEENRWCKNSTKKNKPIL